MNWKNKTLSALVTLALIMTACGKKPADNSKATLVLDYVVNTNHTGVYVALEKGFYKQQGIELEVRQPGDNATSISVVASGKADFGISYQEDITYALASDDPMPIKAIAAIIQHNTSGFVSVPDKGIDSIKDLEGKTYAGWGTMGEEAVIKAAMHSVGADFSTVKMVTSDGSGPSALQGDIDFMWFFEGWDLIKARQSGIELNYMPLIEIDPRLDYYTPAFITGNKLIQDNPDLVKAFMQATKQGYEYAIQHPEEAAEILFKYAPEYDYELLLESQKFLSAQYRADSKTWGLMKDEVWNNYTEFMYENELINRTISASECYTNEFIGA